MTDVGIKFISQILSFNTSIEVLSLYYNSIGINGMKSLVEALKVNKSLTFLNVYAREISEDVKNLMESISMVKVTTISLDQYRHNLLANLESKKHFQRDEKNLFK